MTVDPIIMLGIDNCFASKRWTKPESWCEQIAHLGLGYIEASADTECDPLYMGSAYTADWVQRVKLACEKNGVQIANFYSGHGTYATLGLSHWDARVRARFRDAWIKPQIDTAAALGAGIGFFAHAFDETVLQEPAQYEQSLAWLYSDLADIAAYAAARGVKGAGVEQMYSPHQPPWTIESTQTLLRQVYALRSAPFYVTLDVGHMNGQQHFLRPTEASILQALKQVRQGEARRIWMGSQLAARAFRAAAAGHSTDAQAVQVILHEAEKTPYLFAQSCDTDPYRWVEALGCWSPIVHLQQSDGNSSPHWPFDAAHNAKGIIDGGKLLRALAAAYDAPQSPDMPPMCEQITLTLEPFVGTADDPYAALEKLRESVRYWRRFIPRDGLRLSELTKQLEQTEKA